MDTAVSHEFCAIGFEEPVEEPVEESTVRRSVSPES